MGAVAVYGLAVCLVLTSRVGTWVCALWAPLAALATRCCLLAVYSIVPM